MKILSLLILIKIFNKNKWRYLMDIYCLILYFSFAGKSVTKGEFHGTKNASYK